MNDPFLMEQSALRLSQRVAEISNRHEAIMARLRKYTEQNNINAKTFDKMREINGKNITRIDIKITVEGGANYDIALGDSKETQSIMLLASRHVERVLKKTMRDLEKHIQKYSRVLSKHT
jgi:hypothetical protein